MDIYAHVLPSMQEAATAEIQRLYFGNNPTTAIHAEDAVAAASSSRNTRTGDLL
jgi:hypothetical protein